MNAQIADLTSFYRPQSDEDRSLFEIWEEGGARGDSITPSVFCAEYRSWMREKILGLMAARDTKTLLSLGSGNAAVEGEIVERGFRVHAVDAMPEAVELARGKGVDAVLADLAVWTPDTTYEVIYMDGLLGHLYDAASGTLPLLARVLPWLSEGGVVVASNDSTQDGSAVQTAPGVTGFHWLSGEFIGEQARAAGFASASSETFVYERPVSGPRNRAVVVAVAGE
ncbi:methyltransferase domain-containing protein [Streptomyces sp. TRM66268-LWL]|uniref:Methyltransferase domain-containing protein n=1 Tax=Streptomyces polyasparticus TaxID=2767826 RepID=A0ABR7SKW1_9ACTN|nr:methyltransferase domain-containing protein [Streptomyces polyasparticus]MBC9716058.1 methyltransferase domain-containing protein [Streptomyces polyasparticus]